MGWRYVLGFTSNAERDRQESDDHLFHGWDDCGGLNFARSLLVRGPTWPTNLTQDVREFFSPRRDVQPKAAHLQANGGAPHFGPKGCSAPTLIRRKTSKAALRAACVVR